MILNLINKILITNIIITILLLKVENQMRNSNKIINKI